MRMPGRWLAWDSAGCCVPAAAVLGGLGGLSGLGGLVTVTGGVDVVAVDDVVVGGLATIPSTL